MTALTPTRTNAIIVPPDGSKDQLSRLRKYAAWLDDTGRGWAAPDLAAYRDYLSETLAPVSVSAYLSTVRARYQMLLRDPVIKKQMYTQAMRLVELDGYEPTPANAAVYVAEIRALIQDAIHPSTAPIRVIVDQDPTHVRLTQNQANALIRSITKPRDKVVVSLLLATGIRSDELVNLRVSDLRQHMDDGTLALLVQDGKGGKSRKVPYGGNEEVLRLVDSYVGSRTGYVFPGAADGHVATKTVRRMLRRWPAYVNGEPVIIKPHDTRRSYARMQYMAGMDIEGIQENLGHEDIGTTRLYIGAVDLSKRLPQAVLEFS